MQQRILTVTQLNEYVGNLLNGDPVLRALRVQGELSGFKRHNSGHMYFQLKDENAVLRCVMFRSAALSVGFQPQDGMKVIVDGYASLYTKDGQFQLYVQAMQKDGEGELYQRFLLLKTKLEAMGYFDAARKRSIPFLPQKVGVVTSGTGAALQDILQIIRRRFPNMDVVVCPVLVQGAGAAADIAKGIRALNEYGGVSVLIVGRGGGSMEDLWAFNEPEVVKAVFESRVPVISAVGHETDITLCDFTADLRAPTPSAAAELAVPAYDALLQRVDELASERLLRALNRSLAVKRERVALMLRARGFSATAHHAALERKRLEHAAKKLESSGRNALMRRRTGVEGLLHRLHALSPGAVLDRGYAIVTDGEGRILHNTSAMEPAMPVVLHMNDGAATARIERVTAANLLQKGE